MLPLKTYQRSIMSQERLTNLTILSIESDFNVDFNTGIEKIAQIKTRRFKKIQLSIVALNAFYFKYISIFLKYNICAWGVRGSILDWWKGLREY